MSISYDRNGCVCIHNIYQYLVRGGRGQSHSSQPDLQKENTTSINILLYGIKLTVCAKHPHTRTYYHNHLQGEGRCVPPKLRFQLGGRANPLPQNERSYDAEDENARGQRQRLRPGFLLHVVGRHHGADDCCLCCNVCRRTRPPPCLLLNGAQLAVLLL